MNHAKILNLLISSLLLLSSIGFANSPETRDININPCLSTDPDIGDSAFWASKAVEQFADAKFTDAVSTVDACFAQEPFKRTCHQEQKEAEEHNGDHDRD